jgi:hypothetical protein
MRDFDPDTIRCHTPPSSHTTFSFMSLACKAGILAPSHRLMVYTLLTTMVHIGLAPGMTL